MAEDAVADALAAPLLSPFEGEEPTADEEAAAAAEDEGRAPFDVKEETRAIWKLGWPMAVAFGCRMGMAATDSAMVGHLNTKEHSAGAYLAAAALADMCTSVLIVPPLAFNSVLNPLCAQAKGANEPKMAGVWLQLSIVFMTIMSVPFVALFFYVGDMLRILGFSEEVCSLAGHYAKFNVIWPIPNCIYQAMRFYANGIGIPRPAMYNNCFWLFGNGLLCWLFVFGGPMRYFHPGHRYLPHLLGGVVLHWEGFGFVGAALSISCSRTMQAVTYFLYVFAWKRMHVEYWPDNGWSLEHFTRKNVKEFLVQAMPLMGSNLFSAIISQCTTLLVAHLGKLSVAASSAISTVTILWAGATSATFGMCTAVRVAFHLGKGDPEAAKRTSYLTLRLISYTCAVVALVYVPLRKEIVDIATNDGDVLHLAARCIPAVVASAYMNLIVTACTMGVFSAQGRTWLQMVLSFGIEIPCSIGLVAYYVLFWRGAKSLLGVYVVQTGVGAFEALVVLAILVFASDWPKLSKDAIARQRPSG